MSREIQSSSPAMHNIRHISQVRFYCGGAAQMTFCGTELTSVAYMYVWQIVIDQYVHANVTNLSHPKRIAIIAPVLRSP